MSWKAFSRNHINQHKKSTALSCFLGNNFLLKLKEESIVESLNLRIQFAFQSNLENNFAKISFPLTKDGKLEWDSLKNWGNFSVKI